MIFKLLNESKKFINAYKKIILTISFLFIGVFSFKLIYDFQQEQKEITYRTVDDTKFYYCGGYLLGLNQSPKNRFYGEYSGTTIVLYRNSEEGMSEPYIRNVDTDTKTDFLYFWTQSRFGGNEKYERPPLKLNRITGKLHILKGGKTYSCGMGDEWCIRNELDNEEDYSIKECSKITESIFNKEFNRQLDAYKEERIF